MSPELDLETLLYIRELIGSRMGQLNRQYKDVEELVYIYNLLNDIIREEKKIQED